MNNTISLIQHKVVHTELHYNIHLTYNSFKMVKTEQTVTAKTAMLLQF